jgi:hypothetical protein
MSRIKTLAYKNLDGRTASHELGPITIVTGANRSGKTTVLRAIKLALLGYDPKLGKTNQSTFRACGGPDGAATTVMTVESHFHGSEMWIERRWTITKGRVSYDGPDGHSVPEKLLDPSTYFDLSGPARLNYVLSQVDVEKLGIGFDSLLNALTKEVPKTETLGTIIVQSTDLDTARKEEDASVYDWLSGLCAWTAAQTKCLEEAVDNYDGTLKGLVDAKAADTVPITGSVQHEIDELRTQLTAVQKEITTHEEISKRLHQQKQLREKLEATIAGLPETLRKQEAMRERIFGLNAKVDAWRTIDTDARENEALIIKLTAERDAAESACANDRSLATATADERDRELDKPCCPYCGTKGKAWKNAFAAKMDEKIDALVKSSNDQQSILQALNETLVALVTKRHEFSQVISAGQIALDLWQLSMLDLQQLEQQVVAAEAAKNHLATLEPVTIEYPGFPLTAVPVCSDLQTRIADKETQQRHFIARTQDAKRMHQIKAMREEARQRLDTFKLAGKVIEREKARAAEEAFKSLCAEATRFTDGIMPALMTRDGELGMIEGGNWISHSTFSGIEEKLAFAGLAVALTAREQSVCRIVLLDEMGTVDAKNKAAVMMRLSDLIHENVIDQVVVADVSAEGYAGLGTIINIDGTAKSS